MPGRTPSFIVVGLVLIMFLLGFFYMSCSSKTTELRQTLDDFEDRIRTLTMKDSDNERKIESINTRKHDLEEEKSNIQKQMEKKDSEINELNTKLNERSAELQSLKSDKQVLDEQLKDHRNISEMLGSKSAAIEKLQQDFNGEKKDNDEQIIRLKQEVENYKNQLNNLQNNQEKPVYVPNQRFRPLLSPNETIQNSSSLVQQSLVKISNITDVIKEKISNIFVGGNNSIANQTNSTDNMQQLGQEKSANVLPKNGSAGDDQGQNNSDIHQPISQSSSFNNTETKTNTQINTGNAQQIVLNGTNIANNQSQLSVNDTNYRIVNRDEIRAGKKIIE